MDVVSFSIAAWRFEALFLAEVMDGYARQGRVTQTSKWLAFGPQ